MILFLKVKGEKQEQEQTCKNLSRVKAALYYVKPETLEYVLLEMDNGEQLDGYETILNYCEFWDGVE